MTGLEILVLIAVLVGVLVAAVLVRALAPFIVNAVAGLLVLFLSHVVFGLSIAVTPVVLVIVGLGGILGAAVVLLFALFGVAFVP
ncbi:hypothetical protein HTZ84_15810 [Haloterrigena sp. SYSU A558-1]|uniref:SigmaK-factor processing regulatory BofA n=3 Tax=Haloterrigena TaxID=121871 RepID=M0CIC8_9EURY|nr:MULTISPECIES: hypothetical protein [Haloterrigena]ELZ23020.1 hypothetical protein C477_02865 [Haloterrigena salina JCM 13891]NUB90435.1 hypothetical protein [Haloterrigena gelatinilytica]NUC73747.1 hypothetical protein [Haloterrigena gelatinilytica]QRV16736.1 hypothetical protein JMJ58_07680 [Haloterrigena salifodinae]